MYDFAVSGGLCCHIQISSMVFITKINNNIYLALFIEFCQKKNLSVSVHNYDNNDIFNAIEFEFFMNYNLLNNSFIRYIVLRKIIGLQN